MNNQNYQCKKCGNNIRINDNYCGSCGAINELRNSGFADVQNSAIDNNQINSVENNKAKMNKNAIYSIVCGSISLFIFWWLGIIGLSCGIKAFREIKNTGEKGKILAILGIVISAVDLILYFYGQFFL